MAVVLCFLLGLAGIAFGQADVSKGSLSVLVEDSSGAVVPGATVTLTGPMGEQKATSNPRGEALFLNLTPGTYTVRVEFEGFKAYRAENVIVRANERTSVQAVLEPGVVTEVVEVRGSAITVDTASTTVGSTITQEIYTNLPVGRNIANLFRLSPGVAPSGVGGANPSISGASGLENYYIIDGISATDQGYGAFGVYSIVYGSMGTGVNFDFVKEVQIKTGGFEAQYGQALGGVVNIVTASGGNELHGAVYGYVNPYWAEATYKQPNAGEKWRDDAPAGPRTSSPLTEIHGRSGWDVGFNLGGPVLKNRFFWYGAFNPTFAETKRLGPENFGTRSLGYQYSKRRHYNWVGKINFNLTDNHRLEGTAFGDPSRLPAGVHRSLLRDDLDSESKATFGTRNWAVKYNGNFGANTLLNASFAWNHTYFTEEATKNLYAIRNYAKPKPNATYTLEGGIGYIGNSQGDNKQISVMFTRNANVLGGHQFDIGYAFQQIDYDAINLYSGPEWQLPSARGIDPEDVGKTVHGAYLYLYPSRTIGGVVYRNVYRVARGNFSNPAVETETDYHSAFVQDAWQLNRYLTIKAGLRWEQQEIAGNVNRYTFAANWAPRVGFIIDPTGTRRMKLFANWGRFFEKIPQDLAVRAMSQEESYIGGYFTGLPLSQATVVPNTVFFPTGTEPTIIYGGTKSMYQEEIAAGFERDMGGGLVISARFVYRDLKRALEDISGVTVEAANAGIHQQYVICNPSAKLDIFHNPKECTGGPNCDPETGFTIDSGELGPDGVPDTFPDPRRVYKALELAVEKRFAQNWAIHANYRLAKLFGNYEGLFRNDNGQSDPNITSLFDFIWSPALADQFKVGVLPTDRRHVANIYGHYLFRNRLNIGMGWQILSGAPISKLLAHPAYLNAGEIPVGGRGALGRTPTQNYFDLRLDYIIPLRSEKYRLKAGANLFNLFNRKTVTDVDMDYELSGGIPNGDFLKPLAMARPFYAAFSLRLEF